MKNFNMHGTGVALVTPFTAGNTVDMQALQRLVDFVIEGGVEYLVVLGTTAETPVLSEEEKRQVVEAVIRFNKKRVPMVLGMGGNNTSSLVNSIQKQDFEGIDAILSVAPYYNKPGQEGLYRHFREVTSASPVPVILYNVPGRTGSNISAATCLRLAGEFGKIIGVKEASGDLNQVMEIIRNKPEGFSVVSGDDALALPMTMLGGSGVISVLANAFPAEFSRMTRLCLDGGLQEARDLHYRLLPVITHLFAEGNPAGVKAYLHVKGLIENRLRLPLVECSDELLKKIRKTVEEWN